MYQFEICWRCVFNPLIELNILLAFKRNFQKREFYYINLLPSRGYPLEVIKRKLSFQNDEMGDQIKKLRKSLFDNDKK